MPKGYPVIIAAVGGIVLFAALFLGAYFGSLYSPDHKQYQSVAGNQRGQGDYQGPSQSLLDISGLPSPVERAIANPRPTTGVDHEKRDLAAQEASALWAFYMVVASFASVLITGVGTAFLYKQIVLTREAVEDTSRATVAMEKQTEFMQAQAAPDITITCGFFCKPDDPWIYVNASNHGGSKATDFHITAAAATIFDTSMINASLQNRSDRDDIVDIGINGSSNGFEFRPINAMFPHFAKLSGKRISVSLSWEYTNLLGKVETGAGGWVGTIVADPHQSGGLRSDMVRKS